MLAAALVLAAATLAAYHGVLENGFVNYDDDLYITQVPAVQAGLTRESVSWAFTTFHGANWFPLTWLSWMLDAQLYGLSPRGFHATSLALHLANVLLALVAFTRLTGSLGVGAFTAGVFALHPLHVESVAWAAARKDVLSGLLLDARAARLRALGAARDPRRCAARPSRWRSRSGCSRSRCVVTLPVSCCCCSTSGRCAAQARTAAAGIPRSGARCSRRPAARDRGALRRAGAGRPEGGRRAPALENAIPLGCARRQRRGRLRDLPAPGLPADRSRRLLSASRRLARGGRRSRGAAAILIGVSALVFWQRRRRPQLAVGWLWWVVVLAPAIGIVQVGQAALADRYTYLAQSGLVLALAATAAPLAARSRATQVAAGALALAVLLALGVATAAQVRTWRDSETLFEHALRVTQDNHVAHINLGLVLLERHELDPAAAHLLEALRIAPGLRHRACAARAACGSSRGARPKRPPEFELALAASPMRRAGSAASPRPSSRWARCRRRSRASRARSLLEPGSALMHAHLGRALASQGQMVEAARAARRGAPAGARQRRVRRAPRRLLERAGRTQEAIAAYREALALGAQAPDLRNNLAWLLATTAAGDPGAVAEAVQLAEQAVAQLGDGNAGALDTLAVAYAAAGRREDAARTAAARARARRGERRRRARRPDPRAARGLHDGRSLGSALAAQQRAQVPAGVRGRVPAPPAPGVPCATSWPPCGAALGPEVDHPVGGLDHVEVVLDHDHACCPRRPAAASTSSSLRTSSKWRPGGRLVEDVERAAGGAPRELARELDALRLAARERRRRLARGAGSRARRPRAARSGPAIDGCAANSSRASRTVSSSTSAIDLPL